MPRRGEFSRAAFHLEKASVDRSLRSLSSAQSTRLVSVLISGSDGVDGEVCVVSRSCSSPNSVSVIPKKI